MANPKMTDIARALKANGWRPRHRRNHVKWFCPCGAHIIVTSSSPGGRTRAQKNDRARARRCPSWKEDR